MSAVRIAGVAAVTLVIGAAGFAQSNSQTSSNPTTTAAKATTTVVGCVMKETDYRQAHGLGKGALRGAGLGDEYVIIESSSADCANPGSGMAYRTTGHLERDLKPFVGRRVAVTGHLQHLPGTQSAANDQQPGKLPPEIVVASFRAAPGEEAGVEARNNTRPAGTSGRLPKTAGEEPLVGLIGLMALGAGISLTMLRRAIG